MTDPIERVLLTALFNMLPYRAPNAKIIGVIYDSDIPQLVRDIRAGLAGEPKLPPSLAAKPNIAFHMQTLEQLYAERDYWDGKIADSSTWGASLGCAVGARDGCIAWIARREREAATGDMVDGEIDTRGCA